MAEVTSKSLFDPAPESDPALQRFKQAGALQMQALIEAQPDTEAPQEAWDQYATPVPVVDTPMQIDAPRAIEAVKDSPYAQPGSTFLPVS